ncbi:P-type ATPase [Bosea sp. (in: a-proteobacteria)]|uniref:P-type ATPase n=1 Tax=Bosea sp. (in: a-proteobacteria) TaxID=1871050 RepID=UPI00403399C7
MATWLLPGDKVTAGTMNCDGCLTVRAEHSGQQTVIADIVRLVEMAQASGPHMPYPTPTPLT